MLAFVLYLSSIKAYYQERKDRKVFFLQYLSAISASLSMQPL